MSPCSPLLRGKDGRELPRGCDTLCRFPLLSFALAQCLPIPHQISVSRSSSSNYPEHRMGAGA
jgi:hypothetical protein